MIDPHVLAELRARREQAHKDYYFAPISGLYEKGLLWGILCTLDDVLDRVTGGKERLDRAHRYELERLTDTWTGSAHYVWSDCVVVGGKARIISDEMFAPLPAWWLRAAAKGDVCAAVAQAGTLGTCQVVDSLGHHWDSGDIAFGVNPVGILPHPQGWEVVWMRAPNGGTYARVFLDDHLVPLTQTLVQTPSPYGPTSQGFLDLVMGAPLMTDQNRVKFCGPMHVYLPTTRGDWTIGQDGDGDRIVAWHAGRQQAYEVMRMGTQVPSHLVLTDEPDGPAAVLIGGTGILVYERAFVPWEPWVTAPVPVPPPVMTPPVIVPPAPVPVPVPLPPVPAPTPVPPAPVPPASQPAPAHEPVPDSLPNSGGNVSHKRKPNIAKALRTIVHWLVKFGNVNHAKPGPATFPVEPVQVWPETAPTPVPEPVASWPTRADVLNYKGHLCNLRDSKGGVVWTPSLPGCPADVRKEWLHLIKSAKGTHVPIGPFGPGEAYPGIGYVNPDWRRDAAAIRWLVMEILDAGMVPVVFTDGGPRNPIPRLTEFFPVLSLALHGLDDHALVMPCGWEPVVGDFTSAEVSWALREWKRLRPNSIVGYHGSPTRLVGSSNPVEPDDPWQGGESEFYKSHGGEFIDIALYQTPHGRDLYTPCTCPNAAEKFGHRDECWVNRFEDYVARIGAGYHGWRVLPLVLFETVAYEFFRGQANNEQAREIARLAKREADKWGVTLGYGNGLP